jgi:hypothetical protein
MEIPAFDVVCNSGQMSLLRSIAVRFTPGARQTQLYQQVIRIQDHAFMELMPHGQRINPENGVVATE